MSVLIHRPLVYDVILFDIDTFRYQVTWMLTQHDTIYDMIGTWFVRFLFFHDFLRFS